jgi:pimeloyl-ACP methyl ester carboxylesterase
MVEGVFRRSWVRVLELAVVAGTSWMAACTSGTRSAANGGAPGAGGATSGGAPTAFGGTTALGGTTASGGGATSGGAIGFGGTTTSGGALGVGGATSGGVPASGGAPLRDASAPEMPDGGDASDGAPPRGAPVPPPTPEGCLTAEDVTPGVHQVTCDTTIDVVTVPEQCTTTACGVIVDAHGGMMSSQMEDKNTNLSALGLKYGYLVIQPNALQNAILLNQRLFVADTPGTSADDTRVMDILTQVMKVFHADTRRIHMTGFSEGGFMTWRWFCRHSDLLASIAPGAAAWQCADLANLGLTPPEVACEFSGGDAGVDVPAHDIPVLYVQGSKDGLVDPKCADSWLKSNVFPALGLGPGQAIAGDTTYTRTRYTNPDGVPFEYIQHDYQTTSSFFGVALAGHCYPGSTDLAVTPTSGTTVPPDQLISFGCNDTCSFNWGEEVMKFFIAHPKR